MTTTTEQPEQTAGTVPVPAPIDVPELFVTLSVRFAFWHAEVTPPTVTEVRSPAATVFVKVKPPAWQAEMRALPPWTVPVPVPSDAAAAQPAAATPRRTIRSRSLVTTSSRR